MFHAPTTESKQHSDASRTALKPVQTRELSAFVPATAEPATERVAQAPSPVAFLGPQNRGKTDQVARLQSTYGNQAVLRMLSQSAPTIQTKLTVNQPGDPFEQEADRVADQVMRMTAAPPIQRKCSSCEGEDKVQRKCAECEEEEKKTDLHWKETTDGPQLAPPSVQQVLSSSGRPLDAATRAFMEPRFGYDFSDVRVHTDSRAAESAQAVQASAYTVGPHIAFGANAYNPHTTSGLHLLAHELSHVIQQAPQRKATSVRYDLRQMTFEDHHVRRQTQKNHNEEQSASQTAQDDGVGPEQVRRVLEDLLGRDQLRLLEQGITPAKPGTGGVVARKIVPGLGFVPSASLQAPVVQRVGPVAVIGGAAAAVALCAFGFFKWTLDHYPAKGDKWMHCYCSCKIATYCGGGIPPLGDLVGIVVGAGKEVLDYVCDRLGGGCESEWADFVADLEGVACSHNLLQSCAGCCDKRRP